ncbi:hypothetical protein Bbelb_257260 [Branchiostoma belcheri]|nr:hypothetical protein Bbelb_257260 [Branchiostoma belcheri]
MDPPDYRNFGDETRMTEQGYGPGAIPRYMQSTTNGDNPSQRRHGNNTQMKPSALCDLKDIVRIEHDAIAVSERAEEAQQTVSGPRRTEKREKRRGAYFSGWEVSRGEVVAPRCVSRTPPVTEVALHISVVMRCRTINKTNAGGS